jgi:glucose 1-dehydrogenase
MSAPAADPRSGRVGLPGLEGKNLLVTGGASGIGQAIAVRFARHGANVAINYRTSPDEAAETEAQVHACMNMVRQQGVRDVLVKADVSSEEDVVRMLDEASEHLGGLDILVNNAGIQISRPSEQLGSADFDRVLAVNLRGAFLCARETIKRLLSDGKAGAVINISSVHQVIPKPGYLGYSVSKGGMQNLTSTLALEYAWVDDPVKAAMVTEHIPLGRAGTAHEMAAVCAFLASDDAAYITGQTIFVDGGLTLYADFREPWSSE